MPRGVSITLAAKQGHPKAQYEMGQACFKGIGVKPDEVVAAGWFHLAAEQHLPEAQSELAITYRDGVSFPPDAVQACMWLNLAAAQPDDTAGDQGRFKQVEQKEMERMKQTVKPQQWEAAQQLAQQWRSDHPHP